MYNCILSYNVQLHWTTWFHGSEPFWLPSGYTKRSLCLRLIKIHKTFSNGRIYKKAQNRLPIASLVVRVLRLILKTNRNYGCYKTTKRTIKRQQTGNFSTKVIQVREKLKRDNRMQFLSQVLTTLKLKSEQGGRYCLESIQVWSELRS